MSQHTPNLRDLKIDIYCDSAHLEEMQYVQKTGVVAGFTTNPSLISKAIHDFEVQSYEDYARRLVDAFPHQPLSFEVLSDEPDQMEREALQIQTWGDNVYVKIPIVNTRGESTKELIHKLGQQGLKMNITLIFTEQQIHDVCESLPQDVPSLVSVFAGRIADSGVDPMPYVLEAKYGLQDHPQAKLLWASTREIYNIFQAEACGCEVITVPPSLIQKLTLVGRDLHEYSVEGAQNFAQDAMSSRLSLAVSEETSPA